jgi:hypothetical protein
MIQDWDESRFWFATDRRGVGKLRRGPRRGSQWLLQPTVQPNLFLVDSSAAFRRNLRFLSGQLGCV